MIDTIHSGLFLKNSLDHQMHIATVENEPIEIDNTMLHSESFQLEESICSDDTLLFGSCEASCVRFRVSNIINALKGKQITVDMAIEGEETPFRFGTYKVLEDKPTADRSWRDVTAYDAMFDIIHANVTTWYNGLSFPMTLKQFRDSFFNHLGITQETVALANDSMTVIKTVEPTELSGKQVVNAICEINGTFGHIGRDNKFHYIEFKEQWDTLLPSNDLFPADNLYPSNSNSYQLTGSYISAEYEDFETAVISGVRFKRSGDDGDTVTLVGTANNVYSITDNFLVFDKSNSELETIGTNFLSKVRNATYRPFKAEAKGNPCLEVGDNVRLNTQRMIINSFLWQRTLSGIQALRDTIETGGTEKYEDNMNSLNVAIAQLQRADELMQEQIEDFEDSLGELSASLTHTAGEIVAEVSSSLHQYDTTGYNITNFGLSEPSATNFPPSEHENEYYLNQKNGYLYRCDGTKWTYVKTLDLADDKIRGELSLKIDYDDDGRIISLINGSADRINFTARNMFTVNAPNLTIDRVGNVTAENFLVREALRICHQNSDPNYVIAVYGTNGSSYRYYQPHGNTLIDCDSGRVQMFDYNGNKILESTLNGTHTFYGNLDGSVSNATTADRATYANTAGSADYADRATTATYCTNAPSGCIDSVSDSSSDNSYYHHYSSYSKSGNNLHLYATKTNTSDERLKQEVESLSDVKDVYMQLNPVSFRFKDGVIGHEGGHDLQYGFLAQDIEKDFAENGMEVGGVIGYSEPEEKFGETQFIDDKVHHLNKDQLHAFHVKMIQEQQKEIESLKAEIKEIKEMMKER